MSSKGERSLYSEKNCSGLKTFERVPTCPSTISKQRQLTGLLEFRQMLNGMKAQKMVNERDREIERESDSDIDYSDNKRCSTAPRRRMQQFVQTSQNLSPLLNKESKRHKKQRASSIQLDDQQSEQLEQSSKPVLLQNPFLNTIINNQRERLDKREKHFFQKDQEVYNGDVYRLQNENKALQQTVDHYQYNNRILLEKLLQDKQPEVEDHQQNQELKEDIEKVYLKNTELQKQLDHYQKNNKLLLEKLLLERINVLEQESEAQSKIDQQRQEIHKDLKKEMQQKILYSNKERDLIIQEQNEKIGAYQQLEEQLNQKIQNLTQELIQMQNELDEQNFIYNNEIMQLKQQQKISIIEAQSYKSSFLKSSNELDHSKYEVQENEFKHQLQQKNLELEQYKQLHNKLKENTMQYDQVKDDLEKNK